MMSEQSLEAYRRMTPSERLRLTLAAMREAMPHMLAGPSEVVDRRFELLRREKAARNRILRQRLAGPPHEER